MLKLLIVDDEPLEREALKFIVTANFPDCFEIGEAENGRETIGQVVRFQPDLIFLDIRMPGCNGIEAVQAVREIIPDCQIIIISAYQRFNYAQSAISLGAVEYLTKPASPVKIVETLARILKTLEANRRKKIQDAETACRLEQLSQYFQNESLIRESRLVERIIDGDSEKALALLQETLDWFEVCCPPNVSLQQKVAELLQGLTRKIKLNASLGEPATDNEALWQSVLALQSNIEIRNYAADFVDTRITELDRIKKTRTGALIAIVSDYLEKNYAREISLEDVAVSVNISSFYLCKLFKKELGENFIDYLTGLRIRKAKEILADPRHTVKDVCYMVGYRDPNYFSRVFKKISGMTPSEYQNKAGR